MARLCNWSTETPRFQRCLNIAEPGTYRCAEHQTKKVYRRSGDLTGPMKKIVRKKYDYRCAVCGEKANQVDHIRELNEFPPDKKYLANMLSNLQLLCDKHHEEKTNTYRTSLVEEPDYFDYSTSGRNRKKKRRKRQGFYYG